MRLAERAFLFTILLNSSFCQAVDSDCYLNVRVESEQQSIVAGSIHATVASRQAYALLQALLSKAGCTLTKVALPAGRSVKMLEDGSVAIMVGMSKTFERSQFSYFIGPHHSERMVVVARSELQSHVSDLYQLLNTPGLISITEGAYYGPLWQKLMQDPLLKRRLFYAAGNQQKLAMLVSDRVVATLEDEAIIDELLQYGDLATRYVKLFVIHENPVYFAFSRQAISPERYQALRNHWQQMQESGEVERIKNSFFGSSLEH